LQPIALCMPLVSVFHCYDNNSISAYPFVLKQKMPRGKGKLGIPSPPLWKKVASAIPATPATMAPAAVSKQTAEKDSLIESH